jgi:hypothetical protein
MAALNGAKEDTKKKTKSAPATTASGSMFADLLNSFGEDLETGKVSKRKRAEIAKAAELTKTSSTSSDNSNNKENIPKSSQGKIIIYLLFINIS